MLGGGGLLTLLIVGVAMFLGVNPRAAMQVAQQVQPVAPQAPAGEGVDDEAREFIAVILRTTEEVWTQLFQEHVQGGAYRPPKLIIFSGTIQSGCGPATAAVGPFYCPADQQVYIDPSFFDQLAQRHNAPGDFAQAYVIAHEVSHHVQKLIGFSDQVERVRRTGDKLAANRASVRLELQADYLAGVWAHHAQKIYDYSLLEEGDIAEGINAANQIGDDTLMKQATGYVIPERFTHGTSEQRVSWFTAGLRSGDMEQCQQLFDLEYEQL
jgi:predicted metalloprotease